MNKIIKIAQNELRMLFNSPIAWVLLAILMVQLGMQYFDRMDYFVHPQETGGVWYSAAVKGYTNRTFAVFPDGIFLYLMSRLYLYLPFIAMGLMSKENSTGTIKLLYSSPVKIRQIVLGKFFGMVGFCLAISAVLAIFMILSIFHIDHVDLAQILAGIFGLFLLQCSYSAIGLFMSCLTNYQVVAAIGTFAVLASLNYIDSVWQHIDFVRDLTNYLAITGRTENFINGLITTKDIGYYLLISTLFLGFASIKLHTERKKQSGWKTAMSYTLTFICVLTMGYISSLPKLTGYWDVTRTERNTISDSTKEILKQMDDKPLEVVTYINLLDYTFSRGYPSMRKDDVKRWEPYVRFKPDMKFSYVYYYDSVLNRSSFYRDYPEWTLDSIARKIARYHKVDIDKILTPAQIHKIIDLRPEGNRYVMQLNYEGRSAFLRLYNDMKIWPRESEVAAALKRLIVKQPKIGMLAGAGERDPEMIDTKGYANAMSLRTSRYALINQGFEWKYVDPEKEIIPNDLTALVIADPRQPFSASAITRIQKYIHDGGNMLIATEPDKVQLLSPILDSLGISVHAGQLLSPHSDLTPDFVLPILTSAGKALSASLNAALTPDEKICMHGASSLSFASIDDFRMEPLCIIKNNNTWLRPELWNPDSIHVKFSPEKGDRKSEFVTMMRLTRNINGRFQKIIVAGDADFINNQELMRFDSYRSVNADFCPALFRDFSDHLFPVDTFKPLATDNYIHLKLKNMFRLKLLLFGLLPGLLVIGGSIYLIRRRRN